MTTALCTTRPQPTTGRRHVCSWQHFLSVSQYRDAREAAEQAREDTVGVYGPRSPEWSDYSHDADMITFKTWLINMGGARNG